MAEFVQSIKGMSQASKSLILPIVSGNVSFYNETNNKNIPPTPQIGAVGLIADYRYTINNKGQKEGDIVYLVGKTNGHLSCSAYERCFYKFTKIKYNTLPPDVNLKEEKRNAEGILSLIKKNILTACHDISDGGLIIAILEMCLLSKTSIEFDNLPNNHAFLFGEDQSRYIITINNKNSKKLHEILKRKKIFYKKLGYIKNYNSILKFPDKSSIYMDQIKNISKKWINKVN